MTVLCIRCRINETAGEYKEVCEQCRTELGFYHKEARS